MNCHECKYWASLPGNAHIQCDHPKVKELAPVLLFALMTNDLDRFIPEFGLKYDLYGFQQGWFNWPMDFDPTWLHNCNCFIKNETKKCHKK